MTVALEIKSISSENAGKGESLRGKIGAGLGLDDIGSQNGGFDNLNNFGVVLSLSGDPGCGKSIRDLIFTQVRSNILERTVVGRVTTSVMVT
jgi:hypothetical protein